MPDALTPPPRKPTPDSSNQDLILTHVILSGLTPLIPIPFVDDLVKAYFQRRCIRKIAIRRNYKLTPEESKTLGEDPDEGCLLGCLGKILLYPLKWVFRRLLFFLRWKKTLDRASHLYHRWYLADYALQEGLCAPVGPHSPEHVRKTIDKVCAQTRTSPVEHAFYGTLNQSKSLIKSVARTIQATVMGVKKDATTISQAVEAIADEQEHQLEPVTQQLHLELDKVPKGHFEQLCARFLEQLSNQHDIVVK